MRILFVLFVAVAASGCGLLGSMTRGSMDHRPIKLLEQSKVDNNHVLHSNDPILDKY